MLTYFHPFSVFVWTGERTIRIRHVRMRIFLENEEKQSPFSKISEYERTGRLTRISTRTTAFAHYAHTHVSI